MFLPPATGWLTFIGSLKNRRVGISAGFAIHCMESFTPYEYLSTKPERSDNKYAMGNSKTAADKGRSPTAKAKTVPGALGHR